MKHRKKDYTEKDFSKDMAKALGKSKDRIKPRINKWEVFEDDCPPFFDIKRSAISPNQDNGNTNTNSN